MELTELQQDALKEVIHIGVGRAAQSLNALVETPISLRVPKVTLLALDEGQLRATALGWGHVASVQLAFSGPLQGTVLLIFPYEKAVKLVSMLTGDTGSNVDVDGIRAATLEETGNIVLNGVVGSISNLLKGHISFSIPYYSEQGGLPARLAGMHTAPAGHMLFVEARFGVDLHEIEGGIFLIFAPGSLESLVTALDRLIESPADFSSHLEG